jgi:glycosyltransferase involved in cell wall biosynthesis
LSIVHVARSPVGGVFRHIADLVSAQNAAGHSVGFICDSNSGGDFEAERIAALAPELALGVVRLPMRRSIGPGDLPGIVAVERHMAPMRPDVIHAHGAKGGVFGRLAASIERRRGRHVAAFYAPHGGSLHYDAASLSGRMYFAVERGLERLTDGLLHVSAFEAEAYRRKVGVPLCPAHVVVNGLRPEEFTAVAPASDRAEFLFIGALRDLKGVDVFLQALALLGDHSPARAVLVGSGERADEARYRSLAQSLGLEARVTFLPPMPAREAFGLARIVVVPSRAESMPYIVLEAAAGRYADDRDRCRRDSRNPSRRGRAAGPSGDTADLADVMRRALLSPERMEAEAALRQGRIREKFSLDVTARRVERHLPRGSSNGVIESAAPARHCRPRTRSLTIWQLNGAYCRPALLIHAGAQSSPPH